jgi:hypothetical protein
MKREMVAYHEAGHAVIAWKLHLLRKAGASIVSDGGSAGRVHTKRGRGDNPELSYSDSARLRVERSVMLSMAGIEAQRKYSPSSVRHGHGGSDRDHAIDMLMCVSEPTSDEFPVYEKLLRIRTRAMVNRWWPQIEAVAAKLLKCETLTLKQIRDVIDESMGVTPWQR